MRFSFIRFKVLLALAVLVLFVSVFANRLVMAKGLTAVSYDVSANNLPAEFVWTTNLSGMSKDVFQKINYKRKLKKLKPLVWHRELAEMAEDYSKEMADDGFFSHFDADGNSIVERADDYDIKGWLKIGENLFQCEGYTNPTDIAVRGWLKSPTHRKNIYDKEWTHTGIGVHKTRRGEIFITQVFIKK